jgi:hypothetical protein
MAKASATRVTVTATMHNCQAHIGSVMSGMHNRSNWLFAGSLRAGRRAAVIMSLIQSAKLNGHDPYRYLKDVLERLPTHPASRIDELLPHCWKR